jgi:hypothetical protein
LLREEILLAAKEKRREKRQTKGKGGSVSQNIGREGTSEREAREKTHLKAWHERNGAVSCRRRRVRGGW